MTAAEMEAEAQLSEFRVEALQQLNSELSGSRISLPPDEAPGQLLWHSPAYGAGQNLQPTGIPADLLPPAAVVNHGRSLGTPEPAGVGLNALEQQRMQSGQESFRAFHRGQPDRRTVFDLRASPGSYESQHVHRDSVIRDLDAYRASEAAQLAANAAPGFSFPVLESRSGRRLEPEYPAQQPQMAHRHPGLSSYGAVSQSQASARRGDGLYLQRGRQSAYPEVDVGVGICMPDGPAFPPDQPRYRSQQYEPARQEQPAFSVAQSSIQQRANPSPMFTPVPQSSPDPAARRLEWLQQKFDAVLAANGDPAVLASLLQQIDKATDALNGTATPPKGVSNRGADVSTGSPEYKSSDASVLAVKEDVKASNEMIKALGLKFEEKHKATKLMLDTPPKTARVLLQSLLTCMASAVPDGPHFAAMMALTIPLKASEVPASAVQDVRRGVTPPCIAARRQLESMVDIETTAGSGSKYLETLRAWRLCVSGKLTTDTKYSMLQQTYSKCLRSLCTDTLLGVVGAPADALDLTVSVLQAIGHTSREDLLEAYQCLGEPMRPPEFANTAQPQDLLLWFKIALTVRMDHAQVIGMDPAVLAYLAFLQGLPEGAGDMAHALAKLRANCEGFLSSDEPKNRDVILEFITAEHDGMGTRRWNGSLKSLKPPSGHGTAVHAWVAEASPAANVIADAGDQKPIDAKQRPVRVCHRWQTNGKGCNFGNKCQYDHPNGKPQCSENDRVCAAWFYEEDGCNYNPCKWKHPNGKSKSDAPFQAGRYNKRDITPVGQRHTPVVQDDVVKPDPTATAARERNKGRRVNCGNPESD